MSDKALKTVTRCVLKVTIYCYVLYFIIYYIIVNTVCTLADSGFFKNFLYQGGVKSTVCWVFEDLKFKILECYDQNWCFPDSAQLAVSV